MILLEDSQQQLIPNDISTLEIQLKLKLPESFKKFLIKNNGGYPIDELFFRGYEIDEFFSIKYGEETIREQLRILTNFFDNEKSVPFADSNGGIIYININNNNKIFRRSN